MPSLVRVAMTTPLDPMRLIGGATGPAAMPPIGNDPTQAARTAEGKTFSDVMKDFVNQVDQTQVQFDEAIGAVERGETDNLHRVMLAQSQAQISLKLAAEVRNKLVEAYKEVMRTQF
jgi:flagellar hook-basal body complex protein FliE